MLLRCLLAFATLLATAFPARAQCEDECNDVSDLLSECSLPPLSSQWDTDVTSRNLTGMPTLDPGVGTKRGPATHQIANYSQAACFCPDVWDAILPCTNCRLDEPDGIGGDEHSWIRAIRQDCLIYGYFADDQLAFPSTTRTALPSETAEHHPGPDECDDACGVIHDQITSCDLPPLDDSDWPSSVWVPDETNRTRDAIVLHNRTSAECLCTQPFLRHELACRFCLVWADAEGGITKADNNLTDHLDDYGYECAEMGYWTDDEWIEPDLSLREEGSRGDPGPGPTPMPPGGHGDQDEDGEEDASSRVRLESSALIPLAIALSFLFA